MESQAGRRYNVVLLWGEDRLGPTNSVDETVFQEEEHVNMQTTTVSRRGQALRAECRSLLWIALVALGDILVVELFNHKAFTDGLEAFWAFVTGAPLAFLVDALLVLATMVPALFLRRRVFWCALMSAVWLAAGAVNGFILLNRMTPFTMADITVLNSGLDTLPNYLSKGAIVLLILGIVVLIGGLVLLFWKGPRCDRPWRTRWRTGLAAVALCAAALGGAWSLAFQTDQLTTVFSNLAYAYEDYGFPYCFLQTWLNRGIHRPFNYGSSVMTDLRLEIQEAQDAAETAEQTDVNVIIVQLESFIDPEQIQGLTLSQDAVPNWRALKETCSTGILTVPVVGAGTANTECEVLTGMSTRLFGPGEYPYETCLQDQTVESIAYILKEKDYATHAIHNHEATFYNRDQVYPNLGFDDFTSIEYMPAVETTPQNWAKDAVLEGQICKALDATPDQMDLVFTVTVQDHGKYPDEPVLEDPPVTVTACPDPERRWAAEYYVNQLYETDAFIGKLVEALEQREEKTILVLYGDHQPALGLESGDMAGGSLFYTEYIIWDNFGLERQEVDLTSYQLSAYVLSRLGITDGYLNAFHQFFREEPGYLSNLRRIQYDTLYGHRYLTGGQPLYAPTDMDMGMCPIAIGDLYRSKGIWYVSGENFSPYCRLYAGEKALKTTYLTPRLLRLDEEPGSLSAADLEIRVIDKDREILSQTE